MNFILDWNTYDNAGILSCCNEGEDNELGHRWDKKWLKERNELFSAKKLSRQGFWSV